MVLTFSPQIVRLFCPFETFLKFLVDATKVCIPSVSMILSLCHRCSNHGHGGSRGEAGGGAFRGVIFVIFFPIPPFLPFFHSLFLTFSPSSCSNYVGWSAGHGRRADSGCWTDAEHREWHWSVLLQKGGTHQGHIAILIFLSDQDLGGSPTLLAPFG